MLIYKKATPAELQTYRGKQIVACQKDKLTKQLNEKQVNILLDLFILFANQRTFTIKIKDIESQNILLGTNQDSVLFSNVLKKMSDYDEQIEFLPFVKLYLQEIGSSVNEYSVSSLFSTITNTDSISKDTLKALANELEFQLKEKEFDEIIKIVSLDGQQISRDDLIMYMTKTIGSRVQL